MDRHKNSIIRINFLVYFSCSYDEIVQQKQFKGERISFGSQFKGNQRTAPRSTLGSMQGLQEGPNQ